jgi:hypothetical protein
MTQAILVVLGHAAAAMLLGWAYFRRHAVARPPLGVLTLGDVAAMIGGIILIPYLYLALPGWLVAALLALAVASVLVEVWGPVLPARRLAWLAALLVVGADIALARRAGTTSTPYFVLNNLVLVAAIVGTTNLWAQAGMRARDLAILAGALVVYDFVATSLLPLTDDLIARLAGLPFTPLVAWPTGDGRWLGLGLGDLLLATLAPLVLRKAYGRTAGLLALALALGLVGVLLALPALGRLTATFPVMVVLGPLIVLQHLCWARWRGPERTTRQYLEDEPASPRILSRRA